MSQREDAALTAARTAAAAEGLLRLVDPRGHLRAVVATGRPEAAAAALRVVRQRLCELPMVRQGAVDAWLVAVAGELLVARLLDERFCAPDDN